MVGARRFQHFRRSGGRPRERTGGEIATVEHAILVHP
jgi:hypothetical protein